MPNSRKMYWTVCIWEIFIDHWIKSSDQDKFIDYIVVKKCYFKHRDEIGLKWEKTLILQAWITYSLLSMFDPLFLNEVFLVRTETWYAFKETVYIHWQFMFIYNILFI